ncbi:MAG: hypothetical protein ACRCY9_07805, partial [Phycicoccus sp.]
MEGTADDFEAFVAARWSDLEAVALLATLDPGRARAVTGASLAAVRRDWAGAVDSGAPVAHCRTELLRHLARSAAGGPDGALGAGRAGTGSAPAATRSGLLGLAASADDQEHRVVVDALLDALTGLRADVRAAVAVGLVWDLEPVEYAQALHMTAARLTTDLAAARAQLVHAHRAGLAAAGRPPADRQVDADLAALVDAVLARRDDPPDAAALVLGHDRPLRRRA